MSLAHAMVWTVTALYGVACIAYALTGDYPRATMFAGYTVANAAFLRIA